MSKPTSCTISRFRLCLVLENKKKSPALHLSTCISQELFQPSKIESVSKDLLPSIFSLVNIKLKIVSTKIFYMGTPEIHFVEDMLDLPYDIHTVVLFQ